MEIQRIKEFEYITGVPIKVTEMGNIIELQYMSKRNNSPPIVMLPNRQYMIVETGEVRDCSEPSEDRTAHKNSLYRTFATLRGIINTNVIDVKKCRWCTLTYAENVTDPERIAIDYKMFWRRLKKYCIKQGWSVPEYIAVVEPQGRGAWHYHILFIWNEKAPYIHTDVIRELWGQALVVSIKKLDDVDNVGAYLTAYLGDMPLSDAVSMGQIEEGAQIKTVELEDGQSKHYVKGARLSLYPPNFNLYRCSKGIKRPESEYMSQEEAIKKASEGTLTFQSTLKLMDECTGFECIIDKRYYNKIRN